MAGLPAIPGLKELAALAAKPVGLVNDLSNRPVVLRPMDLLRGPGSLEQAVRDRVIVVTGSSSGIGQEAARQIGAAGGTVVLLARSLDKLQELAVEIEQAGGTADPRRCDLSDFDALDEVAAGVLADHGKVDVLVNNAGRSIRRSVALSYDRFHDYERTMQLNYFAAVRLILRFLPGMREAHGGHIINISSAGVQTRTPRFGAYIASKAALDTLCDALQAEVRDENVRFTTIHMPLVRTPMIAPTKMYERFPALTPEQAGALVARAVIHRPRRLGPPFGSAAAFIDTLSPDTMDLVRNRGFKMFPDSRAAKADVPAEPAASPGTDEDGTPNATGVAFANLTRGTHW
ncbi:SDR family NAD(P)-dependent oxidoreductase [Paraconexibacter sp.]|uniref:SDR family NAD(P)-dependent oxidoreductase n=1 Tax=Paraconexibacter sp. TaxID=2949640 RepID=UPI003561EA6C